MFTVLEFMLLINITVFQINPSLLLMLQHDTCLQEDSKPRVNEGGMFLPQRCSNKQHKVFQEKQVH